jgi:hypothetical protein
VARVAAFIPDLLFGSNVLSALQAAGHDTVLLSTPDQLTAGLSGPGPDVVVVDLTADPHERIALVQPWLGAGPPHTLAFFSHVEHDVRAEAERSGFDLVVPRSRMARAAGELVSRLAQSAS